MTIRVLVTNDDGIDSPGLTALADAARAHGWDVTVAAPAGPASGMSAALTAVEHGGRIGVAERAPGVYAVEATPAMISLLAVHGAFGGPPDVVLSGINRGANIGRAILHSGTVGAALTAAYHGVPALAVSLDVGLAPAGSPRWDTAAAVTREVLPRLSDLPPGTVANLNVPDAATVRGLREAGLATFGTVQITLAETGEGFVRTQLTDGPGPGTRQDSDLALLAQGWATLTLVEGITEAFPGRAGRVGGAENRKETAMPKAWSAKRERQYEHIKDSALDRGESKDTAKEIAARTVNKERARAGEAKEPSALSVNDISSARRGGLRSHKGAGGRTRDQLYEEAKKKNIKGRSTMTKAELERAVDR